MNAAQTKKAFLNHFWEAGELLYDSIIRQRENATTERGGNKPGSTRGKARTGTTRQTRPRRNTAGKDAPASAA